MRAGPHILVVADDLTGGADTGVQFATAGSPVDLMPVETLPLRRPWRESAAGLSLFTDSRGLSAPAAAERLQLLSDGLPEPRPRWVYKKVDSCLRGNPGAEIEVLLDRLGFDAALVAPALPAQGRTTIGGVQLIDGIPVAETEFAKDPITPVTQSLVADLLALHDRYRIGRIELNDYTSGRGLPWALRREHKLGCRLIVCDALTQEHLDQLAALVIDSAGRLLPVGSAGLAAGLARRLSTGPAPVAPTWPNLERLLLVCGTISRVTRAQLDLLLDRHPGVRRELELDWLAAASAGERVRCAKQLLSDWSTGVLALQIRLPSQAGEVPNPALIVAGLAGLASELVRTGRVDVLLLSGGETAGAFLRASGGEAIRLDFEPLPGLVLGRCLGGLADGLPVITKAGAFGQEQTLSALYERLSEGNRS